MHFSTKFLLGLPLLAFSTTATPLDNGISAPVGFSPNLARRVPGIGPVPYPYGTAKTNEFAYEGWDPSDSGQAADAAKLHAAWDDWAQMVYFAIQEASNPGPIFKRWFDAGDADKVKSVFLKMFDPSGVGNPTPMMKDWVCEQADVGGRCTGTSNAYSVSNKGQFHFCPKGLGLPQADSLKCTDLDGYSSIKIKSIAFTMVHESVHWVKVGDDALGTHITDKKNGASDCFNLAGPDKLINAQNYAYLAAEAYFTKKGCTFSDPPPGTTMDQDTNDEFNVSPTTFAPGWCGIHVTQYQKNEPDIGAQSNNPEYQLSVCVFDDKQTLLNQFPGSPAGKCGVFVALNGQRQAIDTALPGILYVTVGAVDNDAVLFDYQDQHWGSNDQPHHSNFGSYDSGKREGDTGFSC